MPALRKRSWGVPTTALVVAVTTMGVLAGWYFSWPTRVRAALPAMPETSDRPALLHRLLDSADGLTRTRNTVLEGVAELGRLYHANGYTNEASACWEELCKREPKVARWSYYLADLRRTSHEYEEVVALLEKTLALAPDYAPAWRQLGALKFKSGEIDAAEGAYRRCLKLLPNDPEARLGLIRIEQQRSHSEEARRQVESLVHDVPDFPPGHNLLAGMLAADGDEVGARRERWLGREAGRSGDASDAWLEELNDWCYDPKRLQVLGTMQFQAHRGDRGRALMTRAVELAPEDPAGYAILAHLHLELGELEAARKVLEQGIQTTKPPEMTASLYVNLSHVECALHKPSEALDVARQGLSEPEIRSSCTMPWELPLLR